MRDWQKVAVSGCEAFIGSHLKHRFHQEEHLAYVPVGSDLWTDRTQLSAVISKVDAVVHLAAKNRAADQELHQNNVDLVQRLVTSLEARPTPPPHVIFASSTHRSADNAYGRSKREGERLLEEWSETTGAPLTILVIPNVFGPGCRPFYNSVVATFAFQFACGQQPEIKDDCELELIYVSDLIDHFVAAIKSPPIGRLRSVVGPVHRRTVSGIYHDLLRFTQLRKDRGTVPEFRSDFEARLYATYQSYLDPSGLRDKPILHSDDRGVLMECVRHESTGHIHFSTTTPGSIRGNHYHTRKLEKFCVLRGQAMIRLRRVGTEEIMEYRVSGKQPEVIDIPVFHVHHLENVGQEELYTVFWSNETFDSENPDTFMEAV